MSKDIAIKEEQNELVVSRDTLLDFLISSGTSKKLSEEQKNLYIQTALINKLNPYKKEIYAMAYYNKVTGKHDLTITVAYMVYVIRAEDSGLLENYNCKMAKDDFGVKAVCTIWRKDKDDPFVWEVYDKEYNTHRSLWQGKPITMLKKVAISQAFRLFFSKVLQGMPYTKEEMPDAPTVMGDEPKVYQAPKQSATKPVTRKPIPQMKAPIVKPSVEPTKETNATIISQALKNDPTKEHINEHINEPVKTKPLRTFGSESIDVVEGIAEDAPTFDPAMLVKNDCRPDEMGEYEHLFKFPLVQTSFAKDLKFNYLYELKDNFFDFPVPLNPQLRAGIQARHKYLVTQLFSAGQEQDGIPLLRGFLAALSGEPKTSYWTRQHMQCYKNNLEKLHRASGNTSFTSAEEYNTQYTTSQFVEFAMKLSKDQITAQNGAFLYKEERLPLKTLKAIVKMYMDYFIPLPNDTDPTFKTYAEFRQTLSGGSGGMRKGTSMYDGKITKEQAVRFLGNLKLSLASRQEILNKIFAGGGWNLFGLPKLNVTNRNIVRPLLAICCKSIQKRYQ